MSYTSQAKNEILSDRHLRSRFRNQLAFGLICFGQRYSQEGVQLSTMESGAARLYASMIPKLIPLEGTITTVETDNAGHIAYTVRRDPGGDRRHLLNYCAMLYPAGVTYDLLGGDEGTAAFVCGAFLACGGLSDLNRDYHLEFALPREELEPVLTGILSEVGFIPRQTKRRGLPVVYFHDSEQMEDLLTFMHCSKMSLELMGIKVLKERRNAANRAFNCDSANIDKVVGAASAQIADIRRLTKEQGLEALPDELRETARLRLEMPEASLRELAEALGLSRSGVNHRLKRLSQLAGKEQNQ